MGDDSAKNRRSDLWYGVPAMVQEYDNRRASMAQNLSEVNLKAGCYVWGRF